MSFDDKRFVISEDISGLAAAECAVEYGVQVAITQQEQVGDCIAESVWVQCEDFLGGF